MDMIRVTATQLKAKLGQYMKAVREGKEVIVTDRKTPVAKLVPYAQLDDADAIVVSAPRAPTAPPLGLVTVQGIRKPGTNTSTMLRDDRDRR